MTRHHGGDGPCRLCYGTGLKRYADTPGMFWCHCPAGRKARAEGGNVEDPSKEPPVESGADLWESVQGFPV